MMAGLAAIVLSLAPSLQAVRMMKVCPAKPSGISTEKPLSTAPQPVMTRAAKNMPSEV